MVGGSFITTRVTLLRHESVLVYEIAAHSATLFRNQLRGIGNIHPNSSLPGVGRIASMQFFWGDYLSRDVERGPFRSARDWIAAPLALDEHDSHSILANYPNLEDLNSDSEDDVDDATRTLRIINRLKPLIPRILSADDKRLESSVTFHDDLLRNNILIDDEGSVTGILDWECVSALPLWLSCSYPLFPKGLSRHTKPDIGRYQRDEDGELTELYWEHLLEYETTQLSQIFLAEMERLEPEWVRIFNSSQLQRDFELAAQNCNNAFMTGHIEAWVDEFTASRPDPSLYDRINEL